MGQGIPHLSSQGGFLGGGRCCRGQEGSGESGQRQLGLASEAMGRSCTLVGPRASLGGTGCPWQGCLCTGDATAGSDAAGGPGHPRTGMWAWIKEI